MWVPEPRTPADWIEANIAFAVTSSAMRLPNVLLLLIQLARKVDYGWEKG